MLVNWDSLSLSQRGFKELEVCIKEPTRNHGLGRNKSPRASSKGMF